MIKTSDLTMQEKILYLNDPECLYIMSYEYLRREGTKASPHGLQRHEEESELTFGTVSVCD